jgi:hypothetical protein
MSVCTALDVARGPPALWHGMWCRAGHVAARGGPLKERPNTRGSPLALNLGTGLLRSSIDSFEPNGCCASPLCVRVRVCIIAG